MGMTKTLKERAAEVAELDKEKTPGDWVTDMKYQNVAYDHLDGGYFYRIKLGYQDLVGHDMEFIAHAPEMAKLIADQQERIEGLESQETSMYEAIRRFQSCEDAACLYDHLESACKIMEGR